MTPRLEQLKKLYEADPKDSFCTYGLAMEYAKIGDVEQTLRWLEETIGLDPLYCYAYYQKAKTLAKAGRVAEAKQAVMVGLNAAKQSKAPDAGKAQSELTILLENMG